MTTPAPAPGDPSSGPSRAAPSGLSPGRWSPGVRDGLERLARAHGRGSLSYDAALPPIAAFDFDDTCLDGDISHTLLEDLDALRPGLVEAYRADCRVDLRDAYIRLVGTLVAGRTPAEVADATLASLSRGLRDGRLAWINEIRELLALLHAEGWAVWIVTASPAPVVAAIAGHYGVAPDRVLGMRSGVGPDGRYTHEVLEPATFRSGKLEALRRSAGRDPVLAAGDSVSDRDLLASAAAGLLIDRGDEALRAEAERRGWWIQERWR